MIKRVFKLRNDKKGAAALEFALAGPIVIVMIFGIIQLGLIGHASAGLRNGLGEGARLATIYPLPDASTIETAVKSKAFGTEPANVAVTVGPITLNPDNNLRYRDMTATYAVPMILPVLSMNSYTVNSTRRVYVPAK